MAWSWKDSAEKKVGMIYFIFNREGSAMQASDLSTSNPMHMHVPF
jgi:hypothetical protein